MDIKSIFASRFKSARLMNGFSLQDLAKAIDNKLSRQALHRYEKGEVIPDSEKINMLSEALNVNADYFFRTTEVELGNISYRKFNKMSAKEATMISEKTKEYLSRFLELEEIIGLSSNFINPLENIPPVTKYQHVNEAANILREKWELGKGPLFNIVELLENKKIKVLNLAMDESLDGLQTLVNKSIPVIVYNANKTNKPDRIRFTLLHELAHLLLNFGDVTAHQKETLCHEFSGAMLIPEDTLKKELGAHRSKLSMKELGSIKKQYGISMQAIVMRAKSCGIISNSYTSKFFSFMDQMQWRVNEPIDYAGVEESNHFEQLLFRALIEDQISISKAASLSNMSVAEFKQKHQQMI